MTTEKQFPKKWILLRGLVRSQFHWKNFNEDLKEKLQLQEVATPELSGNGVLNLMNTPLEIELAVAELKAQVHFLKNEPYGIIGISLGGVLAARWAQMWPNEVSHLVLINSSSAQSAFYKRLVPRNYFKIIKNLISADFANIEKFILATTSNDTNIWNSHLQENINFLKQHPVSFKNVVNQLSLASQTDFNQVPIAKKLILTSKQDRLVSYQCSELIAKLWGCDIFYHDSAGHDLPLDDADWIINKIGCNWPSKS